MERAGLTSGPSQVYFFGIVWPSAKALLSIFMVDDDVIGIVVGIIARTFINVIVTTTAITAVHRRMAQIRLFMTESYHVGMTADVRQWLFITVSRFRPISYLSSTTSMIFAGA